MSARSPSAEAPVPRSTVITLEKMCTPSTPEWASRRRATSSGGASPSISSPARYRCGSMPVIERLISKRTTSGRDVDFCTTVTGCPMTVAQRSCTHRCDRQCDGHAGEHQVDDDEGRLVVRQRDLHGPDRPDTDGPRGRDPHQQHLRAVQVPAPSPPGDEEQGEPEEGERQGQPDPAGPSGAAQVVLLEGGPDPRAPDEEGPQAEG